MSSENHRIAKYQYEFVNESQDQGSRCVNTLYLYDEKRQLLCAFACVSGNLKLAKAQLSPNGHVSAEINEYQMKQMVDMLRNERPAYFSWDSVTQTVRVSSNKEPVGEQEMRKMFSFLYV